jgi:hypothetical protein
LHSVRPYIAKTSAFGKIRAISVWNVAGSAAAVLVTRRTLGSSKSMFRRMERSVAYTVGTPGKTVASSSCTRLTIWAGNANERSSTSVPPLRTFMRSW